MGRGVGCVLIALIWVLGLYATGGAGPRVEQIQYIAGPDASEIVISLDTPGPYDMGQADQPPRVFLDILEATVDASLPLPAIPDNDPVLSGLRIGADGAHVRLVADLKQLEAPVVELRQDPARLAIIWSHPPEAQNSAMTASAGSPETRPQIRYLTARDSSEIFIPMEYVGPYDVGRADGPPRVFVDIPKSLLPCTPEAPAVPDTDPILIGVRMGEQGSSVRVVADLKQLESPEVELRQEPPGLALVWRHDAVTGEEVFQLLGLTQGPEPVTLVQKVPVYFAQRSGQIPIADEPAPSAEAPVPEREAQPEEPLELRVPEPLTNAQVRMPVAASAAPAPATQPAVVARPIQRAIEQFKIRTQALGLRRDPESRQTSRNQRPRATAFHGRVYWNWRNDFLDAVPHQVRQTGGDQSILRRNQYGFNVSGPVNIPGIYQGGTKTFFSFSYEGMRETSGEHYLRTIATLPERSGDFSQLVDSSGRLLPVYDPATTRPNPSYKPSEPISLKNLQYERDPFPGNMIDPVQLDRAAMDAIRYYPTPNVAIGPYFQNNYTNYSPEVNKADGIRATVDQTLGDRHRLSFELSYSNGYESPAKIFDTIANPGRPNRDFQNRGGEVSHVFTISPSTVNTIRFSASLSTTENEAGLDSQGQPFPVLDLDSYLDMGVSSPVSRTARTDYNLSNGFNARRGDHSLTVTGRWSMDRANSFLPRYPTGNFDFSRGLTSLPGIVNTGHAFASFLLGMADYAEQTVIEQPSYFQRQDGSFSVRDEWQVRPSLTVTLRLGLDVSPGQVEKYNRQSTVDLTAINPENGRPGALVFAGLGGYGRSFQPTRYLLSPSISIAWSPYGDSSTVIRANYQRWRGTYWLTSGHWGQQGFIGTPTFISENPQLYPALLFEDGLPPTTGLLPDLRPDVANNTYADLVDMSGVLPTTDWASFTVERQLPGSLSVTVDFGYQREKNAFAYSDGAKPNAVPLSALKYRDELYKESFIRKLRPYPQYQDFNIAAGWPVGKYSRTAAELSVQKRTSQGLSMQFSYTFSKAMDDYSSYDALQDYYNRANEWALTPWSSPHRLSLSYLYELPFGPNKPLLNGTGWQGRIFEGWMISGSSGYSTGSPISLRAEYNNTGDVVAALYVNPVPGVDPRVANPNPELWFNPNAFVNPPDFSTGVLSRTHPTLRNPSNQNHDLSVTKRFSLEAGQSLEFIGTALNFLNHANWNDPDNYIGTEESPNTNAGKITGSRGGRVMQLGLRYTF